MVRVFDIFLNGLEIKRRHNFISNNYDFCLVTAKKSAITSDLISLSALLRLVIWTLDDSMNLALFSLLIGTITCFLDGPFIVMLIFGFGLLLLLITL